MSNLAESRLRHHVTVIVVTCAVRLKISVLSVISNSNAAYLLTRARERTSGKHTCLFESKCHCNIRTLTLLYNEAILIVDQKICTLSMKLLYKITVDSWLIIIGQYSIYKPLNITLIFLKRLTLHCRMHMDSDTVLPFSL